MSTARPSHPGWLALAVAGCMLGAGLLAWLGWRERAALQQAETALRAKAAERDRVAAQSPQPSAITVEKIETELAAVRRATVTLETALAGQSPALLEREMPAKPVDAYFELAAYVEKNRALAAAARTAVPENGRFGFAMHQTEGPTEDLVPAVARQSDVLRHLLEALFEAAPQALGAVQRERPLSAAQLTARRMGPVRTVPTAATGETAPEDFFTLEPALSLFVPGQVDTLAFRLEFVGRTASLRAFLNSLAAFKLPLFVRSVEVEPLASTATADAAGVDKAAEVAVPVVTQNLSKFAVVVELVELIRQPTGP